jgi:hypothetical protein
MKYSLIFGRRGREKEQERRRIRRMRNRLGEEEGERRAFGYSALL